MVEISTYNGVDLSSTTSSTTTAATTALTSDFETFLTLMTTQAQYQDPLDPMDSSDYTAQLAQFSSVEQQVLTNETLSSISDLIGLSNLTQMTGWVGQEVRSAASASFDGSTPITVQPDPATTADQVDMVVYDQDGTEVQRVSLPLSGDAYEWDGTNDDGTSVGAGTYTFGVESYTNGELILSSTAEVYNLVTETQSYDDDVVLILASGDAILASTVNAVRTPDEIDS